MTTQLVSPFQLKPFKVYETIEHKHKFILMNNQGKNYIWQCEICNTEYRMLKIVFYRQFGKAA